MGWMKHIIQPILYFLSSLFRFRRLLIRRHPSTPTIASPVYCVALAKPKSITQSVTLALFEIGRNICAKDSMYSNMHTTSIIIPVLNDNPLSHRFMVAINLFITNITTYVCGKYM